MAESPLEIDFPCESCGYNLRGLAGRTIRCPECGTERAYVTIIALHERRKGAEWDDLVARVSFGANVCAAAIAALILVLLMSSVAGSAWIELFGPFLFILGVIWSVGLAWFFRATRNRPARWLALVHHQRWAVPYMLLLVGYLGLAPAAALVFLVEGHGYLPCAIWVVVFVGLVNQRTNPLERLAARARAPIETLLRATAIE